MATIEEILVRSKVIAVVGLSDQPERPSFGVAKYLQSQGYRVIPVNPNLDGPVLGERPYPSLEAVPEHVDLVDIFRRPEDVPPVVESAIAIRASAVWMQLGIIHDESAKKAAAAGLDVVMDRCTAIEHRRLRQQDRT
ncbi:MAG: CoA-binding protein [Dehalococcoidia bacterium]